MKIWGDIIHYPTTSNSEGEGKATCQPYVFPSPGETEKVTLPSSISCREAVEASAADRPVPGEAEQAISPLSDPIRPTEGDGCLLPVTRSGARVGPASDSDDHSDIDKPGPQRPQENAADDEAWKSRRLRSHSRTQHGGASSGEAGRKGLGHEDSSPPMEESAGEPTPPQQLAREEPLIKDDQELLEWDPPLASQEDQICIGVSWAEWGAIKLRGLRGDPVPEGGSQLHFPRVVDRSAADVVIQVNSKKCLDRGFPIYVLPSSGFYIDSPDRPIILTPEFFCEVRDARTSLPLSLSEESDLASSDIAELTDPPPSQPPPGFYFQHTLPPELRRKKVMHKARKVTRPKSEEGSRSMSSELSSGELARRLGEATPNRAERTLTDPEFSNLALPPEASASGDSAPSEQEPPSPPSEPAPPLPPLNVLEEDWGVAYENDPHWAVEWGAVHDPDKEWPEGYRLTPYTGTYKLVRDGRVCVPQSKGTQLMADLHEQLGHLGVDRLVGEWRRRYNLSPSTPLIPLAKRVKKIVSSLPGM